MSTEKQAFEQISAAGAVYTGLPAQRQPCKCDPGPANARQCCALPGQDGRGRGPPCGCTSEEFGKKEAFGHAQPSVNVWQTQRFAKTR